MFVRVKILSLLLSLMQVNSVLAQTDSSRVLQLNEVTIQGTNTNKQFNFYQSSKLATTEEILGRMEGVNLISRGAFGNEPTLRNYSANQINLSIDGMRIYGACSDRMDPVSIYVEPINLQGISAVHGAQGNFVGSSIGGNINLKFKAPSTLCHKQQVAQFIQSYSTNNQAISSSFSYEKSGPKNGLRLSGTYRHANDYSSPDSLIKYSAYEKLNFSLAYMQVLDSNHQIGFNYLGDWGRNIGYPALPMDVGKADAHVFSLTHYYTKDKFRSATKIYYNNIYHAMDDSHREFVPMHMDMPSWSATLGFYNELNFSIKKHKFQTRIDGHQNHLQSDMTMYPNNGDPLMYMQTMPKSTIQNLGFACQYQLDIKANYFMKWNARVDYFKQWADSSIGSDQWNGMGYDITNKQTNFLKSISWVNGFIHKKGLTQNIVIGYAERLPSSNERYGFYLYNPMDGYDYLGNPKILVEKSYQIEYVLRQDYKKLQWSIQPFAHHTPNYMYAYILDGYYPMTIGAKGAKTYKNIAYSRAYGAEATITYRFTDVIQYRANMKYIYAQTNSGTPLPWVNPFKLQEAVRLFFKGTQFQLEHTFAAAQNRINKDFGERVTPAFNIFNIRTSKSFVKKQHTFQAAFAIENIFNKSYHEHLDVGYVPRMGRNFSFTFGYIIR